MMGPRWKRPVVRTLVLGLAALAAGCASMNSGGAGGASAAGGAMGTAEVTRFHLGNNPARGEIAIEPLQGGGPGFGLAAQAVQRELTQLGWTVVTGNNRSEQVALVRAAQSELAVRLQRRSDGTAIWEGRAQAPAMAPDRLARALFQGFPGESGRTIRVR
jgi:hypothetical protein